MTPLLTIGITTRNRPISLAACLASLNILAPLEPEIIVFDDSSDPPVDAIAAASPLPVRVLRDSSVTGTIVGRNRIVAAAAADVVLLLDDDTRVLEREGVERAIAVLRRDPTVAAVAFAQAEADGRPWPIAMQPSPATRPAIITAFIGFAHLVNRAVFQGQGGYRESLEFYGEEKDLCIRLLDAGFKTVYLPDARVAHVIDRASRDPRRYLRMVARNDCLYTLHNDPIERAAWMLPARFALYFRMRRQWKVSDPGGGLWLARDVLSRLPAVRKARRPVSRATLARWRELQRGDVAYCGAGLDEVSPVR